jgi:hypothetical protein
MHADVVDRATREIDQWYAGCRDPRSGRVARYVVDVGLVVLEKYRIAGVIAPADLVTPGGQVRGASRAAVTRILRRHELAAEPRSEGGRTSPGSVPAALDLVERLNALMADVVADRDTVIHRLQHHLVGLDPSYGEKEGLSLGVRQADPPLHVVQAMVGAGYRQGRQMGQLVAYHLVGAKLDLRFAGTGMTWSGRRDRRSIWREESPLEYPLGDTLLVVVDFPSESHIHRLTDDLRAGWQVVVIVPDANLLATRQYLASSALAQRIEIYSLEQFLGQNIAEMGAFDRRATESRLRELLTTYNQRISASAEDKRLVFQIPAWLGARQ